MRSDSSSFNRKRKKSNGVEKSHKKKSSKKSKKTHDCEVDKKIPLLLTPPSERSAQLSPLCAASRSQTSKSFFFDYSLRSKKKINRAKVKARSEIDLYQWGKNNYCAQSWRLEPRVDRVPRINYSTSRKDFIENFERPNLPVVIYGLTSLWPAHVHWNIEELSKYFGNQKFKIGEDDNGDNVYVKMKHFLAYSEHEGVYDDSPLYIFDSAFSKNIFFKQEPNKAKGDMGEPKAALLNDFFIPKYFDIDLFNLTGSRRPPHRWLVIGGARSGTSIHIDPLGTSAWNALIKGHKRWVLFPPSAPLSVVNPSRPRGENEGISWFANVFPCFKFPATVSNNLRIDQFGDPHLDPSLGKLLGMIEVLQKPGETIFVPGGWSHVVMNLDFTIAVTQNFCSPTNLEYVYLKTRFARPRLAAKLMKEIELLGNTPSKNLKSPYDLHHPSFYRELSEKVKTLKFVPALFTTSSSGSSSSTSSSSSNTVSS